MNSDISNPQSTHLDNLGWSPFFRQHFQELSIPGSIPARVISESRDSFQVSSEYGVFTAEIAGKMRYHNDTEYIYPTVGDWVAIRPLAAEKKGVICAVLPRKSKFSRKVAGGRTTEQIVAANIDTVFIVSGLDGGRNFNIRRLERYLALAWSSGAAPAMVLNKVDLCSDVEKYVRSVEGIAPGVPVHAISAKGRIGLDALKNYLTKGTTVAFLGPSGVGKSALINALLGEEKQATGDVRPDDRTGRHTTTRRELILLPSGGIMIDTPGMREIQMWGGEDELQGAFQDIETLAEECRFTDCSHNAEPGCAVRTAIELGDLDPSRLESYRKLHKEMNYLASREQQSTRLYEKQKWKKISKWARGIQNRP